MRRVVPWIVLVLVTAPLGFLATFALTPFWRWLEATTGVEAIGHSGPADWCFLVVWVALFVAAASIRKLTLRRSKG